jgi:hypothetical protein
MTGGVRLRASIWQNRMAQVTPGTDPNLVNVTKVSRQIA